MMELEKALKQADFSLRLSNINLKEEHKKLVKPLLSNEISEVEFQQKMKNCWNKKDYLVRDNEWRSG